MIRLADILKSHEFRFPFLIVALIVTAFISDTAWPYGVAIFFGVLQLLCESYERVKMGKWNLDYLAFLTLGTAFMLDAFLAGAVIACMVAVSAALEKYGTEHAEKTLKSLFANIPKSVLVISGSETHEVSLRAVQENDVLLIRPHEMLAFDGRLLSERAVLNEANLTGEMEPAVYDEAAVLKSGSINVGAAIRMKVFGDFESSGYRKILSLVEEGKRHPSPIVKLAERYNIIFTIGALALAFSAHILTDDWERFLAVLVIATPCPLLIAAPISFIGGLNKAARKNIIVKSPLALELLSRTKTFFFDKTGTLTLGRPRLKKTELFDKTFTKEKALAIAAALEQHSFHPIAKAFLYEQSCSEQEPLIAQDVREKIGEGVFGRVLGVSYGIVRATDTGIGGIVVDLISGKKHIARFFFDDELKADAGDVFEYLRRRGYTLGILTGDRKVNADRVFGHFQLPIYAECRPEKKMELIRRHQRAGALVGMVGDGMNDAPALALADIGIVFSGTENSASIEAADVAIFGRDAWLIRDAVHIGRRSYTVALQSILLGIGLSSAGMIFASLGFISPVFGAVLQEVIDVIVIVNALRSTY